MPSAECDDTGVFKVDGGALLPGGGTGLEHWTALIPTLTYEVRAFVVSGAAPTTLADLNNDNQVTAADAKALSTIDEMTCNVRVIADNADELRMQAP